MKTQRFKERAQLKKVQEKITDSLRLLPGNEQELFEVEERKRKRLQMKEMQENLWRKWRGVGEMRDDNIGTSEELREKLDRLETRIKICTIDEEKRKIIAERKTEEIRKIKKEKERKKMEAEMKKEERNRKTDLKKKSIFLI